jgi:hypothetical protein
MRRATLAMLLTALVLASAFAQGKITVDPNAPGSRPAQDAAPVFKDSRLDQKITHRVKLRPIADLTNDLTKLTGVTFFAGRTKYDWRVREDCATVMATDLPLSSLVESIAHVMKFRWSRGGKAPNWTYRLVEDEAVKAKIRRRLDEQSRRQREIREKFWDKIQSVGSMSADELAQLREDNPALYAFQKAGILGPFVEFIQQAPGVKDAWLSGQELRLASAWLPSDAQQSLLKVARASIQLDRQLFGKDEYHTEHFAAEMKSLDTDSSRLIVSVPASSPRYPVSEMQVRVYGEHIGTGISLGCQPSEPEKLEQKAQLRALEESRPEYEVYQEMEPQINAAWKKYKSDRWASFTQEPILDHPDDDPALSEPLKEKVAPKTLTGLIESLSRVTGFAFVTDDYRGRTKLTVDKDTLLREALERVAKHRRTSNWNRSGQVIEFWDANWYDEREARVSKAWLEDLRRKLRETGTLDIDDLVPIAALTDGQIRRNFVNDEVLTCAAETACSRRDYLKIYASLALSQRSMLLSGSGLAFTDLTPEQQQSVMKLILGANMPSLRSLDLAALGIRITCTRETQDRRFIYTLKAYTNLGPIPDQAHFRTPLYIEPPKPDPASAHPE